MTLAASPTGLCGAWFENQKHFPSLAFCPTDAKNPHLLAAQKLIENFAAGLVPWGTSSQEILKNLQLDLSAGTVFQQAVWQALMCIPLGQTYTYGQLAQDIGKPSASRAVGAAVGRNPISILIPCHRVIGSQGQMTGYAGGMWRKEALLQLENASMHSAPLKAKVIS
jgi:methylated-DNA-[protein]-cysteine S-methyltransferase